MVPFPAVSVYRRLIANARIRSQREDRKNYCAEKVALKLKCKTLEVYRCFSLSNQLIIKIANSSRFGAVIVADNAAAVTNLVHRIISVSFLYTSNIRAEHVSFNWLSLKYFGSSGIVKSVSVKKCSPEAYFFASHG